LTLLPARCYIPVSALNGLPLVFVTNA